MFRLICLCIGYCIGCIETAYVVGRIWQVDLRQHGSGNLGTTNALRVLGKKAGALVFIGDIMKSVIAFVICRAIFGSNLAGVYGSVGAVLGHNYPFYLKFKGGKGIAATAGLYLSLDPVMTLVAIVLFGGAVGATRYVSLGSILVSIWLPVGTILFGQQGKWGLSQGHLYELYAITIFLCLMAIFRHRKNIGRLLNGTESKLGQKAK